MYPLIWERKGCSEKYTSRGHYLHLPHVNGSVSSCSYHLACISYTIFIAFWHRVQPTSRDESNRHARSHEELLSKYTLRREMPITQPITTTMNKIIWAHPYPLCFIGFCCDLFNEYLTFLTWCWCIEITLQLLGLTCHKAKPTCASVGRVNT